MKTHLPAAIFIFFFTVSCRKDNNNSTGTLNRKWQITSTKILRLDDSFNQGACSYQTQISDFYGPPSLPACQDDDIYDFTDQHNLTIHTGSKKCLFSEPNSVSKPYERKGDSLFINGTAYRIVLLSRDTLILDYCTDMNTYPPGTIAVNRAKIGMKFTGTK